ncbi:VacJ family lipoprotein [Methylomicrobium sp. Wu6]|uniref:MlaA family lipoprotein n=1 Tax=Methylomicrobium sp. Wu6 TaxID=3107928 RepID=UPI002DD6708C|nr:VacJ family lipoprotein [Methylomicrobium sp. Wu6]MEC4750653.1 VacJ family lipoprotein [Methylomicrobium sp. Wu6]
MSEPNKTDLYDNKAQSVLLFSIDSLLFDRHGEKPFPQLKATQTINQQEMCIMSTRVYSVKSRASLLQVFLIANTLITAAGCASTEKHADISVNPAASAASQIDPYEGFNRSMYNFNNVLDRYFFKPVSDSYKFITPDFVETGVSNFFNNLKGINVVLNDVLQGKFLQGASDTGRFLTNTTIGVAGLFDVASELGLQHNVEDFGQTLAVWGVGEGAYIVLPVMGPTTVRDGSALLVDKAANPGTYVPFTGIIEGISDRANAQGALNFIDEAALDPYVFTRESFLQYRRHLINDGKIDSSHDLEIDASADDSANLETDISKAAKPVADTISKSNDGVQPSIQSANSTTARNPALDRMVESFEKVSIKVDQLSNKSKIDLTSADSSDSSIQ